MKWAAGLTGSILLGPYAQPPSQARTSTSIPVRATQSTPRSASMNDSSNPFGEPSANSRQRADHPAARSVDEPWMSLAEWRRRHCRGIHAPHRSTAQLVFVGDSITEAWCESAAFKRYFAQYQPLNLGVGGDQTQHLLWRIQDGALDGISPQAVVVMVGVNNLGNGHGSEQTALGVRAVTSAVREKLPSAPILLAAILPAGETSKDALRQLINETNTRLAATPLPGETTLVRLGASLLEADGTIAVSTMDDFLHPTASGYDKLTEAFAPHLQALVGD